MTDIDYLSLLLTDEDIKTFHKWFDEFKTNDGLYHFNYPIEDMHRFLLNEIIIQSIYHKQNIKLEIANDNITYLTIEMCKASLAIAFKNYLECINVR